VPLACGLSLFTDFPAYGRAGPIAVPYVGDGRILVRPDGRRAGHCLLVVGYDDDLGAVLLRNSFGPGWGIAWAGSGGHMWMAYRTFQALAQGSACFIDENRAASAAACSPAGDTAWPITSSPSSMSSRIIR